MVRILPSISVASSNGLNISRVVKLNSIIGLDCTKEDVESRYHISCGNDELNIFR